MSRIAAEKPVEDARQGLRSDARPGVADGKLRPLAHPAQGHGNGPAGLIIFDRVVGQVEQQLPQAMRIPRHHDGFARAHFDSDPGRLGQDDGVLVKVAHQFIKAHLVALQFNLAGIGASQEREAIDNFGKTAQLIKLAENAFAPAASR